MPLTPLTRRALTCLGYRFAYDDTRKVIVAEAPRGVTTPPLKDREFSY